MARLLKIKKRNIVLVKPRDWEVQNITYVPIAYSRGHGGSGFRHLDHRRKLGEGLIVTASANLSGMNMFLQQFQAVVLLGCPSQGARRSFMALLLSLAFSFPMWLPRLAGLLSASLAGQSLRDGRLQIHCRFNLWHLAHTLVFSSFVQRGFWLWHWLQAARRKNVFTMTPKWSDGAERAL
ncbi:hypothetical protein N7537_008455 [Penicillium hordei]|uniref:Uncharacterized protein n=1 Tax=Penicillium hordei TaxID=40994 RepID=A0AAD6H0E9_9EURO|nr:uncharacterized protein N7537_008455 [Penicillium hordei]KAJ5598371.1 hypothetical protein N7537_008455 [Penicillium hordei]